MQMNFFRLFYIILFIATTNYSFSQQSRIDSLKAILIISETDTAKIKIAKEILKYYVRNKDYDQAEEYANVFFQFAKKIKTDEMLGKAYYNLGIVKWLKKEQAESNQYFEKSVPFILATPDSVLLARCYTKIATNYLRLSDFTNAIQYYENSSEIRMGIKDSTGTANNLINIAGCYYQMAKYDYAIRFYHEALTIAEETGNLKLIAYNFNNIGNIYMKTEDYTYAIEYLLKALEANQKLQNEGEVSKNLLNLGNAFQQNGDSKEAEKYYLESAKIKEKLNDYEGLSTTYNSLGSIYNNLGRTNEALTYFLKANNLIHDSQDKFTEASILANIGSIYLSKQQKEASIYFLKSLVIAKEIKARQLVLSNYSSLIKYYSYFKEYELALRYYELKTLVNDSIYNENTAHAIAEMQTKYETEKKEKENEFLLKDIKIEKDYRRFLIVVIVGLFLFLSTVAYMFRLKSKSLKQNKILHKKEKELNKLELAKKEVEKEHLEDKIFAEKQLNKLQKQKFESELKLKNQELASSALCIVNKNEVLSGIKNKIVIDSKAGGNEDFIPELIRIINNNIDIDQNWQKFKLQFEEVHPGFFDRLKHKHPDLSDIYIKLAAYIRINLTTNEIAQLFNVTISAVKKSRQRIRQKFNLSTEDSLFEFVSNL